MAVDPQTDTMVNVLVWVANPGPIALRSRLKPMRCRYIYDDINISLYPKIQFVKDEDLEL